MESRLGTLKVQLTFTAFSVPDMHSSFSYLLLYFSSFFLFFSLLCFALLCFALLCFSFLFFFLLSFLCFHILDNLFLSNQILFWAETHDPAGTSGGFTPEQGRFTTCEKYIKPVLIMILMSGSSELQSTYATAITMSRVTKNAYPLPFLYMNAPLSKLNILKTSPVSV